MVKESSQFTLDLYLFLHREVQFHTRLLKDFGRGRSSLRKRIAVILSKKDSCSVIDMRG